MKTEPPLVDLDPHEWRLKGARRVKPFKPQPRVGPGKASYYRRSYSVRAILCGLWAAVVIIWAHNVPGQNPWIIGPVSLGPGLLMLAIMALNDDD